MSVIKFELNEKHIKLLKHLEWDELSLDKQITFHQKWGTISR